MARFSLVALTVLLSAAVPLAAQNMEGSDLRIEVSDASLTIESGTRVAFTARVVDGTGAAVDVPLRVVGARGGLEVGEGFIAGVTPGEHELFITAVLPAGSSCPTPTGRR